MPIKTRELYVSLKLSECFKQQLYVFSVGGEANSYCELFVVLLREHSRHCALTCCITPDEIGLINVRVRKFPDSRTRIMYGLLQDSRIKYRSHGQTLRLTHGATCTMGVSVISGRRPQLSAHGESKAGA